MSYEEEIRAYKDHLIRKRKRPETIKTYTGQDGQFQKPIKKKQKNKNKEKLQKQKKKTTYMLKLV